MRDEIVWCLAVYLAGCLFWWSLIEVSARILFGSEDRTKFIMGSINKAEHIAAIKEYEKFWSSGMSWRMARTIMAWPSRVGAMILHTVLGTSNK